MTKVLTPCYSARLYTGDCYYLSRSSNKQRNISFVASKECRVLLTPHYTDQGKKLKREILKPSEERRRKKGNWQRLNTWAS